MKTKRNVTTPVKAPVERRVMHISPDDEWPGGISDGLSLPCSVCDKHTLFDYTVDDSFWSLVVQPDDRRGVICLPCLNNMAAACGFDVLEHIERVQFIGKGGTLVLRPETIYRYA